MSRSIKGIIFDWGGTLHSKSLGGLYPGVNTVLKTLSDKYKLALVSLAKSDSKEGRLKKIEESGIVPYFEIILADEEDKEQLFEEVLKRWGVEPEEVAVIDDRVIRGITWGNRRGAKTIWVKQGKYAEELPNTETGQPEVIIEDVQELLNIL